MCSGRNVQGAHLIRGQGESLICKLAHPVHRAADQECELSVCRRSARHALGHHQSSGCELIRHVNDRSTLRGRADENLGGCTFINRSRTCRDRGGSSTLRISLRHRAESTGGNTRSMCGIDRDGLGVAQLQR